MKNVFPAFRRLASVVALLYLSSTLLVAQVPTKFLASEAELVKQLPWLFEDAPLARALPVPEMEARSQADPNSLGLPQLLALTQADGQFYDFEAYSVWKLPVFAQGALSLNLIFTETTLPEGAQMVIYSETSAMYHGPITAKELVEGNYFSDLIVGEEAVIEVILPGTTKAEFQLTISTYLYGTTNQSQLLRTKEEKDKILFAGPDRP